MSRNVSVLVGFLVSLGVATAAPSFAHPTDSELREAYEDRQRCEASVAPADHVDPGRLGMSAAELQAAVKGLRTDPPSGQPDPRVERGLTRWVREATGGLASVEYELWQDRVFRIRWRLAREFERPVLDELGRRGRMCFGAPDYDQKFEAKPSSTKATLRQIGWTHGERRIELRQLHPLHGGPVYLSVSTNDDLREIAAARLTPLPDPDQSEPWWQRSMRIPEPATKEERERLGRAFLLLLSQLDH